MNRWLSKPLGQIVVFSNERIEPADHPSREFRYIGLEHIESHTGRVLQSIRTNGSELASTKNVFRPGQILYGKLRPYLNKVYLASESDGICSTDILVIQPTSQVIPAYAAYYLRSPETVALSLKMTKGANLPRVSAKDLAGLDVPLPPLPQQRRIVAILDEAENLRSLRQQADRRTADLIPALFHDMYGDPATNPMNWPLQRIDEVTHVQGGITLSQRRNSYTLKLPYLRVANVQRGFLHLAEIKEIGLLPDEASKTRLKLADLLLVEGNGNPQEVGRAALWDGSISDCVFQNHLIRVRCNQDLVSPEYLLQFINSESGRAYFLGAGNTTSGLVTLNMTRVKQCRVPIPPLPLQKQFAAAVADIRAMQKQQAASKQRLDDLFHSLLHKAFRGEL